MEKNIFNGVLSFVATAFTYFFGAWDVAISVLVTFMVLDYTTGVLRAYKAQGLSSSVGFDGLVRKGTIFVMLIVGVSLDRLIGGENWVFRSLVCFYYIGNEGLSLIENCGALGLPIPAQLKDALIQLREGNKKDMGGNQ